MNNCLFCKIVLGEVPCYKLYEDEHVLAFLDINPNTEGHSLVILKKHYATLLDIPAHEGGYIFSALKKVSKALMKGLGVESFNIKMNNFEGSGQEVMHAHFHVIPRLKKDGLKHWPAKKFSGEELTSISEKIKRFL